MGIKGITNEFTLLSGRKFLRIKPSALKSAEMTRSSANAKKSAAHMNSVFYYYYKMCNAIKKAKALEGSAVGKTKADAMLKDLRSAAYTGYAAKGGDLVGVWKYLIANNGVWDRVSWFENNVPGSLGPMGGGGYVLPIGIIKFEEALKERAQVVSRELKSLYGGKGIQQYSHNLKAYKTQKKWDAIAKGMDWTTKVIDKCPMVWAAVASTKVETKYTDVMKRWINLGGYAHKYLTHYEKWERTGFKLPNTKKPDKRQPPAIVFDIAAHLVDKAVPHFGSAYAEVIRGVPGAMRFMAKHRKRMDSAIELANV